MDKRLKDFGITEREFEVFRLFDSGFNQTQIGEILHISQPTVCKHIKKLARKLPDCLPINIHSGHKKVAFYTNMEHQVIQQF